MAARVDFARKIELPWGRNVSVNGRPLRLFKVSFDKTQEVLPLKIGATFQDMARRLNIPHVLELNAKIAMLEALGITEAGVHLPTLVKAVEREVRLEKKKGHFRFFLQLRAREGEERTADNMVRAIIGRICRNVMPPVDLMPVLNDRKMSFDLKVQLALSYLDEYRYQPAVLVERTAIIARTLHSGRSLSVVEQFAENVAEKLFPKTADHCQKEAFAREVVEALKPFTDRDGLLK